jgi:quinol monooxygenase YgiN
MFHPLNQLDQSDQSSHQLPRRNKEAEITRRNVFLRLLTLFAAMPFSGVLLRQASASPTEAQAGSLYKIVTYQVPAEHWKDFLAIAEVNGRASLDEPGITSFSLLTPQDSANTLIAVEVYKDEHASSAHQQTPHFLAFVQGAQKLGIKRSAVVANRYFPK